MASGLCAWIFALKVPGSVFSFSDFFIRDVRDPDFPGSGRDYEIPVPTIRDPGFSGFPGFARDFPIFLRDFPIFSGIPEFFRFSRIFRD